LHEADLDVAGIRYLRTGRSILDGHHALVDAVKQPDLFAASAEAIREETDGSDADILISSENFEYLSPPLIEKLLSLFTYDRVKVIYFYRNWTSLLSSMWQEDVKHGAALSLPEYCIGHIAFPFRSKILNFMTPLDRFAGIVGRENLMVASYDVVGAKGDICEYLFRIIDVGEKVDFDSAIVNRRYDPTSTELIRVMNHMARVAGHNPGHKVRELYWHVGRPSVEPAKLAGLCDIMKRYVVDSIDLSKAHAAKCFFDQFYTNYQDVMMDDPAERKAVFDAPAPPGKFVDANYMLERGVDEVLTALWSPIQSRLQDDQKIGAE
jgi:hypothetical protein